MRICDAKSADEKEKVEAEKIQHLGMAEKLRQQMKRDFE